MKRHLVGSGRSLRFESLENRSLLAGNVTAAVVGGDLNLVGDGAGNGILVQQIDADSFRVTGLGTRVNGSFSAQRFDGVVGGLNATLNGGNDVLNLSGLTFAGDVNVDLGSGNDAMVLNRVRAANIFADLGHGVNALTGVNLRATGTIGVEGGAHRDAVAINGAQAALIGVLLGNGVNSFALANATATTDVSYLGGSGIDAVSLVNVRAADVGIVTGDGNDAVALNTVRATASLGVDVGGGDFDRVTVVNSSALNAIFEGGDGRYDTLVRSRNSFTTQVVSGFEYVV